MAAHAAFHPALAAAAGRPILEHPWRQAWVRTVHGRATCRITRPAPTSTRSTRRSWTPLSPVTPTPPSTRW